MYPEAFCGCASFPQATVYPEAFCGCAFWPHATVYPDAFEGCAAVGSIGEEPHAVARSAAGRIAAASVVRREERIARRGTTVTARNGRRATAR